MVDVVGDLCVVFLVVGCVVCVVVGWWCIVVIVVWVGLDGCFWFVVGVVVGGFGY